MTASAARGAGSSSGAGPGGGGGATASAVAPAPSATLAPPKSHIAAEKPPERQRCPRCAQMTDAHLPFCGHCGARLGGAPSPKCQQCGAAFDAATDLFCAQCGARVGQRVSVEAHGGAPGSVPVVAVPSPHASPASTMNLVAARRDTQPRLALLDDDGRTSKTFVLERGDAVIGRGEADIQFESDPYMSPLHARIELRSGQLWLRDLGSRNGTWVFIEQPTKLTDGDLLLIGSQILRFRRLGYPGPHPPEADSTRRLGSLVPAADVAVLEQLRADGSVRDMLHLSPGRSVLIGRETGDWLFPYDQTMSGRHAEVRSEDSEFYAHDAGSRNGVAMAVRGDRVLRRGERVLLGNEILRVETGVAAGAAV